MILELTVDCRPIDDCRLRQIKIDQRKLNDSANTLVDMAKVRLWDSILLRLIANTFILFPVGSKLAISRAEVLPFEPNKHLPRTGDSLLISDISRIICNFWCLNFLGNRDYLEF